MSARACRLRPAWATLPVAALLVALAGCATVMSEENVAKAYDECLQSGGNPQARLIHCNIAIHSGKYAATDLANLHFMKGMHFQEGGEHGKAIGAFSDALAINATDGEAYYCRGVSRRQLGDGAAAQADFDTALRYRNDPAFAQAAQANRRAIEAERIARERALEEERNRVATLAYNGLWCPRVQRDSMFHQGNEIFIDIVVTDVDGKNRSTTLPGRGKAYQNLHDGATRKANVPLWHGPPQPLMVQVVVWEYDDGGPLVEELTAIAIDFALTRGTRTLSKYAVKRGVHAAVASGGRQAANRMIEQLDLTAQLSQSMSSLPKALVGAENDLIGAIGIANVSPFAYGVPARENGFSYHFSTRHRGGGADCRVYFEFK